LSAGSVFLFLSLAFLFSGSGACACECAIRAVNAAANGSSMRVDDSAWTTIHMYIRTQTGPREGTQTDSCLRQEASTMDRMLLIGSHPLQFLFTLFKDLSKLSFLLASSGRVCAAPLPGSSWVLMVRQAWFHPRGLCNISTRRTKGNDSHKRVVWSALCEFVHTSTWLCICRSVSTDVVSTHFSHFSRCTPSMVPRPGRLAWQWLLVLPLVLTPPSRRAGGDAGCGGWYR
jgi:hypothetical protein